MTLNNCNIKSKQGSWLTIITKDGKTLEVNTQTKTITKLDLEKLIKITNRI